jgi:hypothetical protein
VSTRVLFLLAAEGRVVRGRPRGRWTSSQYEWAALDAWTPPLRTWDTDAACAEVLRRWLHAFGPGTMRDLTWWTGWTKGRTSSALRALDAVEVALDDGGTGWLLPDDLAPVRAPRPWVALLPGLDPTVMGWKERDWFLGPHAGRVFDRNGNAGPTVWAGGRVVGGWGQRRDGAIVVAFLEDVAESARRAVGREVAALTTWLDGTVVVPRFRTPLERELAA